MCIRDRAQLVLGLGAALFGGLAVPADSLGFVYLHALAIGIAVSQLTPVSYTHLDVYKRQGSGHDHVPAAKIRHHAHCHGGGPGPRPGTVSVGPVLPGRRRGGRRPPELSLIHILPTHNGGWAIAIILARG